MRPFHRVTCIFLTNVIRSTLIEYKNKMAKGDKPLALFCTVKTYFHALLLMSKAERLHLFLLKKKKGKLDALINLFKGIDIIYDEKEGLQKHLSKIQSDVSILCFSKSGAQIQTTLDANKTTLQKTYKLESAQVEHASCNKNRLLRLCSKKRITFAFKALAITHKKAS